MRCFYCQASNEYFLDNNIRNCHFCGISANNPNGFITYCIKYNDKFIIISINEKEKFTFIHSENERIKLPFVKLIKTQEEVMKYLVLL